MFFCIMTTFEQTTLLVAILSLCISLASYVLYRQDNIRLLKLTKELSIYPESVRVVSLDIISTVDNKKYELLVEYHL